jgi:N-acetylgalactosamine-6-sulfatase
MSTVSTALLSSLCLTSQAVAAQGVSERPNVVILLADDLGYGDLSSFGCRDIKTPAIDSLARTGVRLTHFYSNAPECTPSRAALLTGRYPQRIGGLECAIGIGNVGRYDEAEWLQKRGELGLPTSEKSLGRLFSDAGYNTAMFGKWHLGYDQKFSPRQHGFEESLVVLGGGTDYVTHTEPDGGKVMRYNDQPANVPGYLTDIFADRAIRWISQERTKPYFLYVPFNAPHDPYQGPDDGPAAVPWGRGNRDVYRKMVEHLDRRIGDVLAAIDRSPAAKNTIVVFLSDNGGTAVASNKPLRGTKTTLWEGGIRVPCLIRWPAAIAGGGETTQVAMNIDLAATLLAAARINAAPERPLDGVSLLDVLRGTKEPFPRTIYWRYKRGDNRRKGVLDGDFKLVIDNGQKELLNLADDPQEKSNLLSSLPAKAAELEAKIIAWEKAVSAPRLRGFAAAKADVPGTPAAPAGTRN